MGYNKVVKEEQKWKDKISEVINMVHVLERSNGRVNIKETY